MRVRDAIMELMEMPISAEVYIGRVGKHPIDSIKYDGTSNTVVIKSELKIDTDKDSVLNKETCRFCIGYVDGHDLKFKYFRTDAKNSREAEEKFWNLCGRNFEHRIASIATC